MKLIALITVLVVAALHFWFLTLEMFLWEHEIGRSAFSMTAEQAALTATLAANQGLYNGFLATGLLWGVFAKKRDVIYFFLICVVIAGVYGALTAKPSILIIQALPAIIALIFTTMAGSGNKS